MKIARNLTARRPSPAARPLSQQPLPKDRELILIVEDDDQAARALGRILRSWGFITARASNGQRALDFLKNTLVSPSLIFLDLVMPIVDGWRFREAQLRLGCHARVPLIAIAEEPVDELHYASLKASGFLRKPFHVPTLLRLMELIAGDHPLQSRAPGGRA